MVELLVTTAPGYTLFLALCCYTLPTVLVPMAKGYSFHCHGFHDGHIATMKSFDNPHGEAIQLIPTMQGYSVSINQHVPIMPISMVPIVPISMVLMCQSACYCSALLTIPSIQQEASMSPYQVEPLDWKAKEEKHQTRLASIKSKLERKHWQEDYKYVSVTQGER
jgi:hypothetical protein